MKYRVEFVDEARLDLERILEFVAAWHAEHAESIFEALERSVDTLTVNPYLGRPVLRRRGRRELLVGRGKRGYVVRSTIDEIQRLVLILGVRGQRERRYHGRG